GRTGGKPLPPSLLDSGVVAGNSGAEQRRGEAEEGDRPKGRRERDQAEHASDGMRPALPDAERAGLEPARELEEEGASEERERAEPGNERDPAGPEQASAIERRVPVHTNLSAANPPTSSTMKAVKTSASRSSTKERMGRPNR